MINIKQLKYFITCADAGSFSEAASVLYTTQSSVSKVIRALEEEMQASLFVRNPHGISLTPNGKQAYAYASRVLENVEAMVELSAVGDTQWLNIAFNPSSWIADCFVRFYQIHEKENLHCQVHTGKMREVLERIHEYKDELGFLYVTTRQQTDLQYLLVRKQLEFIPKNWTPICIPAADTCKKKEYSSPGKQSKICIISRTSWKTPAITKAGNWIQKII